MKPCNYIIEFQLSNFRVGCFQLCCHSRAFPHKRFSDEKEWINLFPSESSDQKPPDGGDNFIPHGQSTWHSPQTGRLIQGLYKPIHANCAIYFYPGVYIGIWGYSLLGGGFKHV